MKEWWRIPELVALGVEGYRGERRLGLVAARDRWMSRRGAGQGAPLEYHISALPEPLKLAITRASLPAEPAAVAPIDRQALWQAWSRATQRRKDEAARRVQVLDALEQVMTSGIGQRAAESLVAERYGIKSRIVRYWRATVADVDRADWQAVLLPRSRGPAGDTTKPMPVEAWDVFKADYLRLQRPSATSCYRRLERIAKERGWELPSYKAFTRRLKRELPRPLIVLSRQGQRSLERIFPAQERDRSVFRAMEAANADGHKFDVFVKWPDGEVTRPIGVFWQDLYSGRMLAWRIDRTENLDSVRLSFGDLAERYGIPSDVWLDNGRAFAAKYFTGGTPTRFRFKIRAEDPLGILTELGVKVHWTIPYSGQSKPIERGFRDFCDTVSRHPAFAGAYTGNSPMAKPEDYGSRAVPLATFLQVLEQEVAAHNAQPGRRTEVCKGRSFDEAFAESYAAGPVRKATAEQRRLWLLAAEAVRVRGDGTVHLLDNRYACDELVELARKEVVVRFDPDHLHGSVWIYRQDGSFVAEAACLSPVGFADTASAREWMRDKRSRAKAVKQQLAAERRMDAAAVAALLPAPPAPDLPAAAVVQLTKTPNLPRTTPVIDPEVVARGEAVVRRLDDHRRQRAAEVLEDDGDSLFARYWESRRLEDAGAELDGETTRWMRSFEETPEYFSRMRLAGELGSPFHRIVFGEVAPAEVTAGA